MRKTIVTIVMLIAALACMAGTASASTVYFDPASVTLSPGSTQEVRVLLSDAPKGLAGYEMILTYPSSTVTATGASFPSWAGLNNKYSTSTGYLISGIDLNKQVQDGAVNIELGTVTLRGVAAGTTTIAITGFRMNDDKEGLVSPSLGTLPVTVEGGGTPTTTTTAATTTAATTTTTTTAAVTTGTTSAVTTTTTAMATTTTTTAAVTTGTTPAATNAPVTTAATIGPAATVTVPAPVMVTPSVAGYPTCGFTTNGIAGHAPFRVQFRDLSTVTTSNAITGWEWSFGDGGSSMNQNPSYTYQTPGTYTVALTVTNNIGSTTSTRTGLIRVLGPGEAMPTVTQAAPPVTTVATTAGHTLPVWTSPQKTAAATTTKKADFGLPAILAGISLAAVIFLVMQRDGRA